MQKHLFLGCIITSLFIWTSCSDDTNSKNKGNSEKQENNNGENNNGENNNGENVNHNDHGGYTDTTVKQCDPATFEDKCLKARQSYDPAEGTERHGYDVAWYCDPVKKIEIKEQCNQNFYTSPGAQTWNAGWQGGSRTNSGVCVTFPEFDNIDHVIARCASVYNNGQITSKVNGDAEHGDVLDALCESDGRLTIARNIKVTYDSQDLEYQDENYEYAYWEFSDTGRCIEDTNGQFAYNCKDVNLTNYTDNLFIQKPEYPYKYVEASKTEVSGECTVNGLGFAFVNPPEASCSNDNDCLAGTHCVSGECKNSTTCRLPLDCAEGTFCIGGKCVANADNWASYETCTENTDKTCTDGYIRETCDSNADCTLSGESCGKSLWNLEHPDDGYGHCITPIYCRLNSDCPVGEMCTSGICTQVDSPTCEADGSNGNYCIQGLTIDIRTLNPSSPLDFWY